MKRLFSLILLMLVIPASHVALAQTATIGDKTELARHDFPYASNYVSVKGSKMHYVDTGGEKPAIVLVHGQPTWSYLWRKVIPHLEKEHRVIAVDLIGFGKSDRPDIGYSIKEHTEYFEGFIDQLRLDTFSFLLHDWGSFMGFEYAARHPNQI